MNKQKGNMYGFVTHTWNPIRGKCPHDCSYCYMKVFKNMGELRLDEKALKDNLGSDNFIFVGSSTDMFADSINPTYIERVLAQCSKFDNKYLFQTKNPKRFSDFIFPPKTILGVTLETNVPIHYSKCVDQPNERAFHMEHLERVRKMVSIEPIMDFELEPFLDIIDSIHPEFVSIGADSKNHKLPEPSKEKVNALIKELKTFTEVKIKDNLGRLTG